MDFQVVLSYENSTSLSKHEIDSFLNSLSIEKRLILFEKLDKIVQKQGFNNLDVVPRYMFIKLLTMVDLELIEKSMSFSRIAKQNLQQLLKENNRTTFADISKEIIATMMEENKYKRFRESLLKGTPNILLIGPYEKSELKPGRFLAPPLGIYRIASFLGLFGIQVNVYDPNLKGEEELKKIVRETKYDFIGISTYQPTIKNDIKLLFELYRLSPASQFIAGGEGASFNYDELLTKTPLNIVVRGWGEFILLDMVMLYEKNFCLEEKFRNLRGLYIKDKIGNVIETKNINPYTQRDFRVLSLTFESKIIPFEDYWDFMKNVYSPKMLSIMKAPETFYTVRLITSSHCPLGCTFCSSTHFLDDAVGRKQNILLLSPEDIINMMKNIMEAHPSVNSFFFNDDNFMIRKDIRDLCFLIKSEFKDKYLKFLALGRVDIVDEELLDNMKDAGFELLSYGIESFSNKILKDMNKRFTAEKAIHGIERTLNSGITPLMNLIIFYPTVTIEDIKKTINTATDLIDKGARATYWPYVGAYRGSSIVEKGYEIEYDNFVVDTSGKKFINPYIVTPVDQKMKELAREADELKVEIVKDLKTKYNWEGNLPQPVDTLAYFYAIYEGVGFSTQQIEHVIYKLMTL